MSSDDGRALRSGSVSSTSRNCPTSASAKTSNGGGGKSKQRKAVPGETTLRRMVQEAIYELEVDPYRGMTRYGIQRHESSERASKVSMSPWETSCSFQVPMPHNENDSADTAGSTLVQMACQNRCPCLVGWTDQQLQKKKTRKRKGSNNNNNSTEEQQQQQQRIGCRPNNAGSRCKCDYNPFCLGSVGGVMDEVWERRLRALISTQDDDDDLFGESVATSPTAAAAAALEEKPSPMEVDTTSDVVDLIDSASEDDGATSVVSCKGKGPLSADPQRALAETLYSQRTWNQLRELRRSTWVDETRIRDYLAATLLDPGTNPTQIDACMECIEKWNKDLIFSNPLLEGCDSQRKDGHIRVSTPPGIENLGATCYLNTQLQCLAQIPAFRNGIFSWSASTTQSEDKMNEVLRLFQDIMASLHAGHSRTITTVEFSNALGLDHYEQQDPNEFSRLFFDLMQNAFQKEATKTPGSLAELMNDVFQGMVKYQTICQNCSQTSHRKEEFMDLNLPIVKRSDDDKAAPRKGRQQSILECLETKADLDTDVQFLFDRYCRDEILEGDNQYYCDQCGSKQNACRRVRFDKIPPLLNIQLSRYIYDMKTLSKRKVSEKVLLPLEMNLESETDGSNEPAKHRYILCAVMIHKGKSAYSGHYVAQAMDWTTGCWFEFNDTLVKLLKDGPDCSFDPTKEGSKLKKGVSGSEDAYNLFYVEDKFLDQSIIGRFEGLGSPTEELVIQSKADMRAIAYRDISS